MKSTNTLRNDLTYLRKEMDDLKGQVMSRPLIDYSTQMSQTEDDNISLKRENVRLNDYITILELKVSEAEEKYGILLSSIKKPNADKANYTIIDQIDSTVTHFQKNKCYVSPKQHTSQFDKQMCDYIDKQNHLYIAHKTSEISNKSVCIEEIAIPTFEDQLKTYRFNQNNVSRSSKRTNLKVNSPEISRDQFAINSPEMSRDQLAINKEINQRRQQRRQSSQPFNKATQRELCNNNKATHRQRKQRQPYRRRSSNRANQSFFA